MSKPDVFYIHGYEGSSLGTKGSWLKDRYSFFGIDMPDAKTTHPLGDKAPIAEVLAGIKAAVAPSVAFMKEHIYAQSPKVIVASSFGSAVWLRLVQEEGFCIPTILLAPACSFLNVGNALPHNLRCIIIHGTNDTIIPVSQAQELHRNSGPHCEFWPIEDVHSLPRLTQDRPELKYAIQKLLLEQGSEAEKEAAQNIHPPFPTESLS